MSDNPLIGPSPDFLPVGIELATPDDIPALAEHLAALFVQEAEFTPDRAAQIRGLNAILNDPQIGEILVARNHGAIVGMVSLLYTVSTALGARVALLEDMVVTPSARGTGIGSRLLQAAVNHARAVGCKRITLLTDQSNETAQRFYDKHGFCASSMVPLRILI